MSKASQAPPGGLTAARPGGSASAGRGSLGGVQHKQGGGVSSLLKKKSFTKYVYAGIAIGVCLLGVLLAITGSKGASPSSPSAAAARGARATEQLPVENRNVIAANTAVPSGQESPVAPRPWLSAATTTVLDRSSHADLSKHLLDSLSEQERSWESLTHALTARALPQIVTETPFKSALHHISWGNFYDTLPKVVEGVCVSDSRLSNCSWNSDPKTAMSNIEFANVLAKSQSPTGSPFYGTASLPIRSLRAASPVFAKSLPMQFLSITADPRIPVPALNLARNLTWIDLASALQMTEKIRRVGNAEATLLQDERLLDLPEAVSKLSHPLGGPLPPRLFAASKDIVTVGNSDPTHGFFYQLFGSQRVTIISPTEWARMRPFSSLDDFRSLTASASGASTSGSSESGSEPFRNLHALENTLTAAVGIIHPGELLYVPPAWTVVFEPLAPSLALAAPSFSLEVAVSQLLGLTLKDVLAPYLQTVLGAFTDAFTTTAAAEFVKAGLEAPSKQKLEKQALASFAKFRARSMAFFLRRLVAHTVFPDAEKVPGAPDWSGHPRKEPGERGSSSSQDLKDRAFATATLSKVANAYESAVFKDTSSSELKDADTDEVVQAVGQWLEAKVWQARFAHGDASNPKHLCHKYAVEHGSSSSSSSSDSSGSGFDPTLCPKQGKLIFDLTAWAASAPDHEFIPSDPALRKKMQFALRQALVKVEDRNELRQSLDRVADLTSRVLALLAPQLPPLPLRQGGVGAHTAAVRDVLLATVTETIASFAVGKENVCGYIRCLATKDAYRGP